MPVTAEALAWRVEETCLNAWPALRQVLLGGWLLRFSDGLSRRVNSANPLRSGHEDLETLIATCEALYQRQRLPPIFRILSIIEPALDQRLATLGYGSEGESCVLYGDISAIESARDPDVQLLTHTTRGWFTAMAALQGHTIEQSRIYRRIVDRIAIPAAFAALPVDGEIAALAYGAIHNRLLCYELVVADTSRRRHGYARRIVSALTAWGREQGAEGACLEVEAGNKPARALYDAVGLNTELYRYHYRREPSAGAGAAGVAKT